MISPDRLEGFDPSTLPAVYTVGYEVLLRGLSSMNFVVWMRYFSVSMVFLKLVQGVLLLLCF